MRRGAVRVTLTLLALAGLTAAGYLAWQIEARDGVRRTALARVDETLRSALRDTQELRASQQAYVAAGQSEGFWIDKVTSLSESLRAEISSVDAPSAPAAVRAALAEATGWLKKFEAVDRRARNYAATGQKLLASDIIFGDGLPAVSGIVTALDQARVAAAADGAEAIRTARIEQARYVAGGLGFLLLVLLLLTPAPAPSVVRDEDRPAAPAAEPVGLDLRLRDAAPAQPKRTQSAQAVAAAAAARVQAAAVRDKAAAPPTEIQTLASVCTDLAKLADTDNLPSILERTAKALDATGLVLWVSDVEGAALVPVATHGYPASVLSRLGTIGRDGENVTAAAFRTGLVQTVPASGSAAGAIAAPLVTPSGCRGVMSAEVRGGEKDPSKLAAAAIVAAQLSSLVGPPPASASEERQAAL